MFQKVLVANRGEIAVRVIRALAELSVVSVAVYSEVDREAPHVTQADEAFNLGSGPAGANYLDADKILAVAARAGAQAIHPGYGFLAENASFARACEQADLAFIGPPAHAIETMGSKIRARQVMRAAGVPIVPGSLAPIESPVEARTLAREIGFPVAVKAAYGGGGKGFRVALGERELADAFTGASREGERFFGDPTVYLERYLPEPRHLEVQLLADRHGNVIHLGERDCSIQRRHQKLIEESPAPPWIVSPELRERVGRVGVEAARAVGYVGAGTVEGLLIARADGGFDYFFLEMNTRVQVEHSVTEMTTGVDIIKQGIRAAAGERLPLAQRDVSLRGHAIECRINAEDAARNFAPAPGRIGRYREPAGPGVRVDSGVGPGFEVSAMYDPLVAKLIVWDADREQATLRMRRALAEYELEGLTTLIPFHVALLESEQWARGETCRDLLEDSRWLAATATAARAAPEGGRVAEQTEQTYTVEVSGRRFEVRVIGPSPQGSAASRGEAPDGQHAPVHAGAARSARRDSPGSNGDTDVLASPLQGSMWKVLVKQGDTVQEGQLLCIIEAMKMENEITAHKAGKIVDLPISEGAAVAMGAPLATIKSD